MDRTALVYTPIYLTHDTGDAPENARRVLAIMSHLDREGLLNDRRIFDPEPASFDALAAVHDPALIEQVLTAAESGGRWLDPDTYVSAGSYEAAVYASGGALVAVDAVLSDDPRRVFVIARPPGHHATPDRAMGFCLFNHLAVAARYAVTGHGLDRVAIVDWDVHHGNGTQEIFYRSANVLYASAHQSPLFPGTGQRDETGEGPGAGTTLNVPLPPGGADQHYLRAFDDLILPAVRDFAPQLILVSAGFDAHQDDPLAMMRLTEAGFAALATRVRQVAEDYCQGRLVLQLEGGYHAEALARSVAATLRALDSDESGSRAHPEGTRQSGSALDQH
jgi:acetoin utilization deacetylase AcuC-like enzyme